MKKMQTPATFFRGRGLFSSNHRIRHSREKRESMQCFGFSPVFPWNYLKLRAFFRTSQQLRDSA